MAAALQLRHPDVERLRCLADEVGRLEADLAVAKAPRVVHAADVEAVKTDPASAIRRLRASLKLVVDQHVEIGGRCERARVLAEQRSAALQQKMMRLDQLRHDRDEAAASSRPSQTDTAAPPRRISARAEAAARFEALAVRLKQTKASRSKAAHEAEAVKSRDRLRELGVGSIARELNARAVFSALRMAGGASPELLDKLDQWMLNPTNANDHHHVNPGSDFTSAKTAAFRYLAESAADPAGNPMRALRSFLSMVARLEAKPLYAAIKLQLAQHFSRSLTGNVAGSGLSRQDRLALFREMRSKTAKFVLHYIEDVLAKLRQPAPGGGRARFTLGDQTLSRQQVSRAIRQCESLHAELNAHHDAFVTLLQHVEDHLWRSLEDDDIEELGRRVAPELDPYYGQQIAGLNAEIAQQRKAMQRGTPAEAGGGVSDARVPDSHADRTEIRINRLQGEILAYEAQCRSEFEQYNDLSLRHMRTGEEVDALTREIEAHTETLRAHQQERRQAVQQRNEQGAAAGRIEQALGDLWGRVRHEPALARLVLPSAFERVEARHLGQSIEQMQLRIRTDQVGRTGTYHSRSGLLRAVADVVSHELGQREPALLAQTREEFERIVAERPAGAGGLCHHGRPVGHGVRRASGGTELRTGTSEYALGWVEGLGPRITHLHPWISPY